MIKSNIILGNCLEELKKIPDNFVNTIVTSPPYFGLRDYGVRDQIGLETTVEDYIIKMVEVFGQCRRILRDDGTLWLNLGDSYANAGGKVQPHRNTSGGFSGSDGNRTQGYALAGGGFERPATVGNGLKPKDLIGIPWRVAFALQKDGWYLRQDIIWHKPNAMPESVKDRCTKSHEYIFLLSKSSKYYFDNVSMREDSITGKLSRKATKTPKGNMDDRGVTRTSCAQRMGSPDGKRNRRSVWSIPTQSFKGAHFATFPEALIEPCIRAGCPAGGIVMDPFGGSGTTGLVANKLDRKFILIELNPEYVEIAKKRIYG